MLLALGLFALVVHDLNVGPGPAIGTKPTA
jgi:hypothetical protein